MLRIFVNSLITHTLYTQDFIFIFTMWDFVSYFKCTSDVAAQGASDAHVEYESLIFTYGGGYMPQFYLLMNYLISAVNLSSYNV